METTFSQVREQSEFKIGRKRYFKLAEHQEQGLRLNAFRLTKPCDKCYVPPQTSVKVQQ